MPTCRLHRARSYVALAGFSLPADKCTALYCRCPGHRGAYAPYSNRSHLNSRCPRKNLAARPFEKRLCFLKKSVDKNQRQISSRCAFESGALFFQPMCVFRLVICP